MVDGIFFDCWDTVLRFEIEKEHWNTEPLQRYAISKGDVSWEEIDDFAESFLKSYYLALPGYEISVEQFLRMLTVKFDIVVDQDLSKIGAEILDNLKHQTVPGVKEFLRALNQKSIYHSILSNTIYPSDKTISIIDELIQDHGFGFFFGSAEVGVKKPNPLFYQLGVLKAKKDIEKCIYIGDTFRQDVYGPIKAGFKKAYYLNFKNRDYRKIKGLEPLDPTAFKEVKTYDEILEDLLADDLREN